MDLKKPPSYLSKNSQKIWKDINNRFELLESDYVILEIALNAYDKLNEARKILKKDGIVLKDDKGKKYSHPCLQVVKESSMILLRAWKNLGLDAEPPKPIGRLPGI